jgi:class 3 adenylate cyclase
MNGDTQDSEGIWSKRLASFNDWPPAKKMLLIYSTTFPAHFLYKLVFEFLIADAYIFDWSFVVGITLPTLGSLMCAFYIWRRSESTLPYYLALYTYCAWALIVMQQAGFLDSIYMMFMLSITVITAAVMGWTLAIHSMIIWTAGSIILGCAQHFELLTYGPAYIEPMETLRASSEWMLMNATFLVTTFFATFICLWMVTNSRDQAINNLNRTQRLIKRYMPPSVAEQIISGNDFQVSAPQRKRLTMLFADIVGFTDIADRVEPEVMTEVLNDYMSNMAEVIEAHGGTLNEFAGDGLMAIFGAPEAKAPVDQAQSAVVAASKMHLAMEDLNKRWRLLGLGKALKTRIGINTGMASVGSYGSTGRMTYTAIGLQTNIAARLEAAASPGQVIVSNNTFQLVEEQFDWEPAIEVECKGVHYPVRAHALRFEAAKGTNTL